MKDFDTAAQYRSSPASASLILQSLEHLDDLLFGKQVEYANDFSDSVARNHRLPLVPVSTPCNFPFTGRACRSLTIALVVVKGLPTLLNYFWAYPGFLPSARIAGN